MTGTRSYDTIIVGAGLVGLALAHELSLRTPGAKVLVLEKEDEICRHQSGRNSGVLHSGIYYKPGSAKARNCVQGHAAMLAFCRRHSVAHDLCGKVIVAVDESERPGLHTIFERGRQNGVRCQLIEPQRLAKIEPACQGVEAIWVPSAGIVDYVGVAHKLAELCQADGHEILLGHRVTGVAQRSGQVVVQTHQGSFEGKRLVACAGLHSDRLARRCQAATDLRIVPFRGEYYRVVARRRALCRNLIYPVPDPRFPFLGVHLTRMIDGSVTCGPNAVLAFAREGYRRRDVNLRDLADAVSYPGLVRLLAKHPRPALHEFSKSWSKSVFLRSLQRLVPTLTLQDLEPAPAGVRAQAMRRDGSLADDFEILRAGATLHVINAPSPAATSCLAIAKQLANMLEA